MITRIPAARQTPPWQQELAEAIRSPGRTVRATGARPGLAACGRTRGARIPAAGAARLRRAHEPWRPGRSAAAPGFAPGGRTAVDARLRPRPGRRSGIHGRPRGIAQISRARACRCHRRLRDSLPLLLSTSIPLSRRAGMRRPLATIDRLCEAHRESTNSFSAAEIRSVSATADCRNCCTAPPPSGTLRESVSIPGCRW